jgi:thiol-disulfide isomerase/thioredoxin
MKRLLPIFLVMFIYYEHYAQGIMFSHEPWQSLLVQAKKENKLIFVDAFTTWCGPCKMMAKQVFTDSAVGAFYNNNFICAKIDMEKGEGIELAETYAVAAYPTFIFVDGNGELQHRSVGYQEPAIFLTLGKTALNEETRIGAMNKRYEDGDRNAEFLYRLAYAKYNAMEPDAGKIAEEYLKTQADWNTPDNLDLVYEFSGGLNSSMTKYLLENKPRFIARFGQAALNRKIDFIISNAANSLNGDNPDFDKLQNTLVALDPNAAEQNMLKIKKSHYKRTKNWEDFKTSSINYYNKYPSNNPQELNAVAWDFYLHIDDKKALEEAAYWAQQAIKIDDKYYCNDTAAALFTKLGNKSKANKYINKAISLAKKEGADYSETEALKEKLK